MKPFNAIATAAVAGASLFGASVCAETIGDHPRWKEYMSQANEQAEAFAYGQKTGDFSRFCQILNKREGIVMTFESNYKFVSKDLARRNEAIRILEKCVEDGYLNSHARQ